MQQIHCFLNGVRGIAILDALVSAGHGVTLVHVPAGKEAMAEDIRRSKGLMCEVVSNVNDPAFIERLHAMQPTLLVIGGYSQIFSQTLLDVAAHGAINLHGGPLPRYRGGSPLNWQLINGEPRIGISVIAVDDGIDTGNVLAEASFELGLDATIAEAHHEANRRFPDLARAVVDAIDDGSLKSRQQDEAQARYWHQRSDDDGRLDFSVMTARTVRNMVRALSAPYHGAFSFLNNTRLRLLAAEDDPIRVCGVPGRVCYIQGHGPFVICSDHGILVTECKDDAGLDFRLPHGASLG